MINMKSRKLEEMSALQLRKGLNNETVAILIFGACENHGDHLPFGSDVFVPMELAKRLAVRAKNVLVLPPFPYGVSSHHSDFQMTLTWRPTTMISYCRNPFMWFVSIYNGWKIRILTLFLQ